MNTSELAADYRRCGPQPERVLLTYVADRIHQLTLADGQHLRDATDFRIALKEIAEELSASPGQPRLVSSRFSLDFCATCGHVHADDEECGFPIGGAKKCRCEKAVVA